MGYLILQIILLVLAVFVIGCLLGAWARKTLGQTPQRPSESIEIEHGKSLETPDPLTRPSSKPATLNQPRTDVADDLKKISGIGKVNEGRLNNLGIFHFDQIAAWGKSEIDWVDNYLSFKGRIEREDWISQARKLAKGQSKQ